MKSSPTLADLARRLDLDKSSISLALRDSPKISAETKARVKELATQLGYRPNLAARKLKGASTRVLGLILPPTFAALHNAVVVRTIQELARLAETRNWLFSMLSGRDLPRLLDPQGPYPFLMDGILAWGDIAREQLQPLLTGNCPLVVLDPNHPSLAAAELAAVRVDNRGGAAQLATQLAAGGAKRLLFVRCGREHLGHAEREAGARAAWLVNHGEASWAACALDELDDGRLRACAEAGGAVFCSNDQGALHVWQRLAKLGLMPPRVPLVGFDGDAAGEAIGLTTALFDHQRLAGAAFAWLEQCLAGEEAPRPQELIPVSLRLGSTS